MNSCLYKTTVMHHRLSPKRHRFHYNMFMFYIDLDELDLLSKKFFLFSVEKFNFFSFRKNEHLQLPIDRPDKTKGTKEQLVNYIRETGFDYSGQRIMLLTNLNILGYNFNPVSFYFVIDKNGEAECAIAEVGNTFKELKPYFLGPETKKEKAFSLSATKNFYVSPFIDHDALFQFELGIPGDKLNIRIDDQKNGERIFLSTLTGVQKELTNVQLFYYAIRFPFLTLQIISLIHWNAFRLWLKKIPFHKKESFPELQKDVFRKYSKSSVQ